MWVALVCCTFVLCGLRTPACELSQAAMIVRIVGGRSSVGHAIVARVGHEDFKYTHWKDDPGVDNMADLGTEGVSKAVLAHLLESSGLHQPGSGHCVATLSRVVGG